MVSKGLIANAKAYFSWCLDKYNSAYHKLVQELYLFFYISGWVSDLDNSV